MRKKQSVLRIVNQFKGLDISEIAVLQSAYSNRDLDLIRQILKKPTLTDSSLKAIGRLSNQYVKILFKPEQNDIRVIKKKFGIELKQNDYQNNLIKLDNIKIINIPPKPKRGLLQILQLSGNYQCGYITKDKIRTLINLDTTNVNTVVSGISDFINALELLANNSTDLKIVKNNVNVMRVFAKVKFKKSVGIVSTKLMSLIDIKSVYDLLANEVEYDLVNGEEYPIDESVEYIESVLQIWINWYL